MPSPPDPSLFADFGLLRGGPSVYLRLGLQKRRTGHSLLRAATETIEPTKHVAALVRMVGGTLIRAAVPDGFIEWHLLLPLR